MQVLYSGDIILLEIRFQVIQCSAFVLIYLMDYLPFVSNEEKLFEIEKRFRFETFLKEKRLGHNIDLMQK